MGPAGNGRLVTPRRAALIGAVVALVVVVVAAFVLVRALIAGGFSVNLRPPRVGTSVWKIESTASGTTSYTETVSPARDGWLVAVTRGTLTTQSTMVSRQDGLYLAAAVTTGPDGFVQRCSIGQPVLLTPNPLSSGRSWSTVVTCPSGDVAGDPAISRSTNRVTGQTVVAIGNERIPAITITMDTTESFGATVVQTTHATIEVDPQLGLPIEQTFNTSGKVTDHRQETIVSLP